MRFVALFPIFVQLFPLHALGQQAQGTLVVEGDFPGALVFVDAEPVGTMPLAALPVSAGEHTVRVTLAGHTEFSDVITVRRGRQTRLAVELAAFSTVLRVETEPPGASVFVDGRFSGQSPIEVELLEGRRSVRVVRQGYYELVQALDATAGQAQVLRLVLEPLTEQEIEARSLGTRDEPSWYEEPWTWVAIGGGALVLAAAVVLVVALTADEPGEADAFCAPDPQCIQWGL